MGTKGPDWLADAIFYEIYPQTFYDSNGDGIGDIPGIIEKLDYVQELGCNALWLNPCFESPFRDAGYDITDFYKVAPRYGTNADLKKLFKICHQRGMHVILDLVAGHSSLECKWFVESSRPEKNQYSNWYIWNDHVFRRNDKGFRFMAGYGPRSANFLTNFYWAQPALNYGYAKPDPDQPWQLGVDHPDVKKLREEIKNVMRFWLDEGCDGFRVDMAYSIVKNDPDHKESSKYWREVRAMVDQHYPEAALISEWSVPPEAISAGGFHADFMLHIGKPVPAYTSLFRSEPGTDVIPHQYFEHSFFRKEGKGNILDFLDHYLADYRKTKNKGYISLPTGNHDLPRLSYKRNRKEQEVAMAFLLTMPGLSFIYYGDEIGMQYQDKLPSKEGGYNRTGARTPMQWTNGRNAGFSTAAADKLYLPVDKRRNAESVEKQRKQKNSLLQTVRSLTALRKENPALGNDAAFEVLYAKKKQYPLVYLRRKGRARFLLVVNPAGFEAKARFEAPLAKADPELVMGSDMELRGGSKQWTLTASPISWAVYRVS